MIAKESPDLHTVTTIDGVYVDVSGASLASAARRPASRGGTSYAQSASGSR